MAKKPEFTTAGIAQVVGETTICSTDTGDEVSESTENNIADEPSDKNKSPSLRRTRTMDNWQGILEDEDVYGDDIQALLHTTRERNAEENSPGSPDRHDFSATQDSKGCAYHGGTPDYTCPACMKSMLP